jgi:hypothetical protein
MIYISSIYLYVYSDFMHVLCKVMHNICKRIIVLRKFIQEICIYAVFVQFLCIWLYTFLPFLCIVQTYLCRFYADFMQNAQTLC